MRMDMGSDAFWVKDPPRADIPVIISYEYLSNAIGNQGFLETNSLGSTNPCVRFCLIDVMSLPCYVIL